MKHSKHIIPVFLVMTIGSVAQTNTQYVLNAAGGHTTINGKHFEFSLGELFTVTGLAAGVKNTPGILQPFVSLNAGRVAAATLLFSAQKKKEEVALHWITSADPELLYCEVEYGNGREWIKLGEVRPSESDSTSRYHFIHDSPAKGNNQYRIKLVRQSGNFSYSPVRNVMLDEGGSFGVYPNPATTFIRISGINSEDIRQIRLFDIAGKQVYQSGVLSAQQIDVRHLTAGTYIISIIHKSGEDKTQKILIQK